MKFKNVRNFIKKIKKDRIVQVSAICIGTMLITIVAHDTNEQEPKDIYFSRMVETDLDLYDNRKETWSVNWNELLGYDKKENYQYMEPLVESTFIEDGKFVKKSGYSITYLNENGDKQISYYDNNGYLLSTSEDYENYR